MTIVAANIRKGHQQMNPVMSDLTLYVTTFEHRHEQERQRLAHEVARAHGERRSVGQRVIALVHRLRQAFDPRGYAMAHLPQVQRAAVAPESTSRPELSLLETPVQTVPVEEPRKAA